MLWGNNKGQNDASDAVLLFLLLTLNIFNTLFYCLIVNFEHVIDGREIKWDMALSFFTLFFHASKNTVKAFRIKGLHPFLSMPLVFWWFQEFMERDPLHEID